MRTSGGREIQIISQSDKDMLATALVQLVARHVPAVITVEQALPLIHDVYSVYEPTWGPGAPLPDARSGGIETEPGLGGVGGTEARPTISARVTT